MIRRPPRSTLFPYTTLFRSLVGAVPLHRFAPGDARERPGDLVARLVPQGDQYGLHVAEHVLHPDERRLEVDLRELRLAVIAQILVAEAARQLGVAVQTRPHEHLLVVLGRL